ncbi:hypothetical protein PMIN06_005112 [Paraphaeosphaeria minitans]|uniref:Arabinogalactan endo-beta-1,4-galactanase n=1 Tax=Paraphaeosphaeria minitans TaxID=565426 RepID=A0A9P6GU04_9PLEO|nr:glycosyl hydrolase family 53 [Paraphaeosphaeria minitans]
MRLPFLLSILFALPSLAALSYKGVDWSSLLVSEKAGRTYKNTAGQTQPLETILKASGVNTVRQRIWVNPSDGTYNLDYNLKLARRAQAAGLQIYLDFHYSDTWADPAHQSKPAAWASLSTDALVTQVWKYTNDVLNAFATAEINVALVSIGNEITPGLLWNSGRLSNSDGPKTVARLLKSASNGVKESNMDPKPKILVHLDNGWKADTQTWWYDTVLNSGGGFWTDAFDVIAISYYPFYNSAATLSSLASSLNTISQKWSKEIMVVETNWPISCSNPAYAFPSDAKSIPFSSAGQTKWLKEVAKRVAAVPGGKGTGLFYWEPAWIDNAGLGSSCGSNLMVDSSGKVLDSLAVFKQI